MVVAQPRHRKTGATQELLLSLFVYDADTGKLFWRENKGKARRGVEAGSEGKGYRRVRVNGSEYFIHRLVWMYVYGTWPQHDIDHINGNTLDNRIGNLRDVPHCWNMQNMARPQKNSTTGYRGVAVVHGKFRAHITVNGRTHVIGRFDSPEVARDAYIDAKLKLHSGAVRERLVASNA